jgi:hypothetical protein
MTSWEREPAIFQPVKCSSFVIMAHNITGRTIHHYWIHKLIAGSKKD